MPVRKKLKRPEMSRRRPGASAFVCDPTPGPEADEEEHEEEGGECGCKRRRKRGVGVGGGRVVAAGSPS